MKIRSILCLALALFLLVTPVAAAAPCVSDQAGLLSADEESSLNAMLQQLSSQYQVQIAVATVSTTGDTDTDSYIADMYDSYGYGYGSGQDGVLLLLNMGNQEYRILSNGIAADALSMDAINDICSSIVSDLSTWCYYDAFDTYAELCGYYLEGHINGHPFEAGKFLIIALVVGLVAGLITVLVMRGQLKTVRRQDLARAYVKPGSLNLTESHEIFLYRNVSRTLRQESSGSRSGSGGSRNVGGGRF